MNRKISLMHYLPIHFFLLIVVLFGMTPMGHAVSDVTEQNNPAEVNYYHYDNLGNTVALTNGGGVIMERIEYAPHGAITLRERMPGFSGALHDTPYLFVGQFGVQTDDTGLLYMRARYYNPLLMRFINADPVGFAGGVNWYAYAGGNPLRFIDPSGFAPGSIGSDFTSFLSKAVEYIPLLGNLLQAERAFNMGNYTQAAIYTGLAVLDVAPPVKLTTTTAKVAMVTSATYRTASTASKAAPVIKTAQAATSTGIRGFRYITEPEVTAINATGMLRGGRQGETFFTKDVYKTSAHAQTRLSLLVAPTHRIEFEIINNPHLLRNGTKVEPNYGQLGKGAEFMTTDPVNINLINIQPLF